MQNIYEDMSKVTGWEHEKIRYANDTILKGSTQAAVTAGAILGVLFALVDKNPRPENPIGPLKPIDVWITCLLVISILGSIFTHFFTGLGYLVMGIREIDNGSMEVCGKKTRGFLIWTAWVFVILQLVTLLIGMGLIFMRVFNSQ